MLRQRVDSDRDRLPGPQAGDLGLLEVGGDVNLVERNEARQPLAGLHIVAGLHGAIADHAVDRRADDGERQIALGLGQRRLELVERGDRFLPLAFEDLDIGRRGIDRRLRALHAGDGLVAIGLRLFLQSAGSTNRARPARSGG